jgi:2-dehydro-3-deoxyphosphogluconate aldolase/(4S)-4-hydroxy-2-oxoglutarate aldolase
MDTVINQIKQHQIIAIVRGANPADVLKIAEALLAGGIKLLEITMNSVSPIAVIEEVADRMQNKMIIGAGTVLDGATAIEAIKAGAKFILSPIVNKKLIHSVKNQGITMIPGAYTPTEIVDAYKYGGDIIKVFPASSPGYIKNILGPLPHIPLLPTGGVTLENIVAFKNAGAIGFGIGSSLVNTKQTADKGYLSALTKTARQFVIAITN